MFKYWINDAGFGNRQILDFIARDRKFSDRPNLLERGSRCLVAEVHYARLELRAVFTEGNEYLLAEGRQWVVIELSDMGRLLPSHLHQIFFEPAQGLLHPFDGAVFLDHVIAFHRGPESRKHGERGFSALLGKGHSDVELVGIALITMQ